MYIMEFGILQPTCAISYETAVNRHSPPLLPSADSGVDRVTRRTRRTRSAHRHVDTQLSNLKPNRTGVRSVPVEGEEYAQGVSHAHVM